MKTMYRPGWESEFQSEVCLPVRVAYHVDGRGRVEVTHVTLESMATPALSEPLRWMHLPLPERQAMEQAAQAEAERVIRVLQGEE